MKKDLIFKGYSIHKNALNQTKNNRRFIADIYFYFSKDKCNRTTI